MNQHDKDLLSQAPNEGLVDVEAKINLSDNVIATMVGKVVTAIDGVHSLNVRFYDNVVDGISSKLGQKRKPGITVKQKKDKIEITIYLNVLFGSNIKKLAETVQEKVDDMLVNMLDVHNAIINVSMEGMYASKEESKTDEK